MDWESGSEFDDADTTFRIWGQYASEPDTSSSPIFFVTFEIEKETWRGHLSIGKHCYYWSSADAGDALLLDTEPLVILEEAIASLKQRITKLFAAFVNDRRECVEVDLSHISSADDFQTTLAKALDFPAFYGRNWDAFWDAISGVVEMPRRLVLHDWTAFAQRLPDEAKSMRACFEEMAEELPGSAPVVEYQ
jgi:RNAse (barnase) inhibitor barstar